MTDHETTLQRNADSLVSREVHLCLSSMVATLASGGHGAMRDYSGRNPRCGPLRDLMALADQAAELCAPVLDYEEAARQAGWTKHTAQAPGGYPVDGWAPPEGRTDPAELTARDACERDDIDPYEWEVYEHWAVSNRLADDLERHGERVDRDFAGLNVWARTTTGQAISMDGVIRKITAEVFSDEAGA